MENLKPITNARGLLIDLGRAYADVRNGEIELKEAAILSNLADKIIGCAKAEIKYRQARNERPDIPFFECDEFNCDDVRPVKERLDKKPNKPIF